MSVRNYRDLIVWQRSVEFCAHLYQHTAKFPAHEQFGLTNQLRRAAVSIPSNIAEGHIQESDAIFARHLNIAIGSAAELDTQLLIAQKVGYIKTAEVDIIRSNLEEIMKMLRGLLRTIRSQ